MDAATLVGWAIAESASLGSQALTCINISSGSSSRHILFPFAASGDAALDSMSESAMMGPVAHFQLSFNYNKQWSFEMNKIQGARSRLVGLFWVAWKRCSPACTLADPAFHA